MRRSVWRCGASTRVFGRGISAHCQQRNVRAIDTASTREREEQEEGAQVNGNGEVNGNGRRVVSETSGIERSKETPEEKSTSGNGKETLKRLGM